MASIQSQSQSQISHQQELPQALLALKLSPTQFAARFTQALPMKDPYLRDYQICKDGSNQNGRVAIRHYCAQTVEGVRDILENMENYRKLGELQGMCPLVAFGIDEEGGELFAAFDYNDVSLQEFLEISPMANKNSSEDKREDVCQERSRFYLFLLVQLLEATEQAKRNGIQIEQIIPEYILLKRSSGQTQTDRLRILYDEREKSYEAVQQGVKLYASPQKVAYLIENDEQADSVNCEQAIFEMGLLLLEVMYDWESGVEQPFSKDHPLSRNGTNQSYILIEGDGVALNRQLILSKMQYLSQVKRPIVEELIKVIQLMIADLPQRVTLEKLIESVRNIQSKQAILEIRAERQSKNVVEDHRHYQTPQKQVLEKEKKQGLQSLQKQTIVSETTIATANLTSVTDRKQRSQDTVMLQKESEIQPQSSKRLLPRHFLTQDSRWHSSMKQKLQKFMIGLEERGFTIKEYYDKSVYYGAVEIVSQKRNGLGMYVYSEGDIYFGLWQQNSLIQGTYLFKNGESFAGTVKSKSGKHGFGTYFYANGNIYEGQWRNDIKCGQGVMKYPNGDIYEGMWSGGKKNGQGRYNYNNGTKYQGNFSNGRKKGFGVITFANGTKVEAYWNETHIEGPGKVFYSNGNYFEGNYHRSEKQGQGLYIWDDTQYQGGFEKDAMEGNALIKFSDHQFYQGRIKNGKRWGHGLYRYSNGDEFEGEWKSDEKLYGKYKFHEGGWFEGRFKNNHMSYGVMVYESGESYEGEFLGGQRQGVGTYRDSEGKLMLEGKWKRDQFVSNF